ncbi:MAG: hypothetical protein R6V10_15475 [bacterium]
MALLLLLPLTAWTQRRNELGSLYGNQNLEIIVARLMPAMVPEEGQGGEVLFGFNTSSKRTEFREHWKLFYGVGVAAGGFTWRDADLGRYEQRSASGGYAILQAEGKWFYSVEGELRPYVGVYGGIGYGSLWMETSDDLPDPPAAGLEFLTGGAETGVHIHLKGHHSLVLSVGADARVHRVGQEGKFNMPIMVNIGVCKWRGPL